MKSEVEKIDDRLVAGSKAIEAAKAKGADPKVVTEAEIRYIKLLGAREYLADWHQQIIDEVREHVGQLTGVSMDATELLRELYSELSETQKVEE